jgi:hypothetical protein
VARIPKEAATMKIYHRIDEVKIESEVLFMRVDGQLIRKALIEISPMLAKANEREISCYEISPSGYGIYWPLIDEDISIDGLMGIKHSPAQWKKSA